MNVLLIIAEEEYIDEVKGRLANEGFLLQKLEAMVDFWNMEKLF